jgi:pSer/pThr/pTyr-binding forkhead associated (FHA) protein
MVGDGPMTSVGESAKKTLLGCSVCGHPLISPDAVCSNCGHASKSGSEAQTTPQNAPPSTPKSAPKHARTIIGDSSILVDPGRKLVGFLVTYSHSANGASYNLYEGRNIVGRDNEADIRIVEDTKMSSKHFSILYRQVDNKFKFRDEQSSNGTYINGELNDDGVLENNDIISAGTTQFIFMVIPPIPQT